MINSNTKPFHNLWPSGMGNAYIYYKNCCIGGKWKYGFKDPAKSSKFTVWIYTYIIYEVDAALFAQM